MSDASNIKFEDASDFIELGPFGKGAIALSKSISIQSNIRMAQDVARMLLGQVGEKVEDRVRAKFEYSPRHEAFRITCIPLAMAGEGFLLRLSNTGGSAFVSSSLPKSFAEARIARGYYKQLPESPNIFVLTKEK